MRTFALACAVLSLAAIDGACARDTGIINQAGPYEQTMKFYLHPAQLSFGPAPDSERSQHPAVLVKRMQVETAPASSQGFSSHPALQGRYATRSLVSRIRQE